MKKALLAYLAGGLLAFSPVLTAWFVADDWDFLVLVAKATSPTIAFTPLVGRFIRPLVVATYYVNYGFFGLWPFPYHLVVVLVHAVDAWLVSLLARGLGLSGLVAGGAGLIFLVFAGHSEAVSWVAGAADPWLVLFLVTALLLFNRGLTAARPTPWIAAACGTGTAGVLAKETAAIAPALFFVYGVSKLATVTEAGERRRLLARTLAASGFLSAIAFASLVLRARIFGSVLGAYSQLGTSGGMSVAMARAFLLRAFVPAGEWLMRLWLHGYDMILIGFAVMLAVIVFVRRPDTRAALAFLTAGCVLALGPALPLSIALHNSVSERYVYLATAFSSILEAWSAELLVGGRRGLTAIAIALLAGWQLVALERENRNWTAAGQLGHAVTDDVIQRVRAGDPGVRFFILNVPDTANGAFVVRAALYGSFHLMAPDVVDPEGRVVPVAASALASAAEHARVEQIGARSFRIRQDFGNFLQATAPASTPDYRFDRWDGHGYDVTFAPSPIPAQVLYVSRGRVGTAGVLVPTVDHRE
jgi:hypothetical protein